MEKLSGSCSMLQAGVAHHHVAELVGQSEEAQEIDVAHGHAQVVVVGGQCVVANIVVRCDAAQVRRLQACRCCVSARTCNPLIWAC